MIEKEILTSILKLTKNETGVQKETISKDAKIPLEETEKSLIKLHKNNLVTLKRNVVTTNTDQRLKIAIQAINVGADIERVCSLLDWKEFEKMVTVALEINGYDVHKNFRFKHKEKMQEIDILGFKQPLILSIDCKHWHHNMTPTSIVKIVEAQIERTRNLADALPSLKNKLPIRKERICLLPVVISLMPCASKICHGVPVVSILQLRDFLSQLPAYTTYFYTLHSQPRSHN